MSPSEGVGLDRTEPQQVCQLRTAHISARSATIGSTGDARRADGNPAHSNPLPEEEASTRYEFTGGPEENATQSRSGV